MRNILVTGGAGFIGSNFVRYMLHVHPDVNVVVYDKLTYAGRLENLQDVAEQFASRYAFAQGDICDAQAVEAALREHDIDAIVNFAAESHVDRSIMNPDAFIQTDVYGTYVLLEAARKFGNLRYHQISTDEVYGHIHGDHRSLETDNLAPRSPYAASKASADHLVNAYHITYDLPITITRGANNIGPYQYPEKVVPLFVTNALNDLPLPVYGDGQQMRDYQYVIDHCKGIDLVLREGEIGECYNVGTGEEMTNMQMRDYQYVIDHCKGIDLVLREGEIGETYNVGTGEEMTNMQMVEILLDELGKPRSLIQHVEDRMGHDRRYCMNVQKLIDLGWEADYTHEEAIRETVRWYVNNPWWWEPIRSGEFKEFYQRLYGERKVIG